MATLTGPLARLSHARTVIDGTVRFQPSPPLARTPVIVALAAALLAGGCAQFGSGPTTTAALTSDSTSGSASAGADTARAKTELEKATEYWGKIYQKEPRNTTAALNYAKNLRAMGQKQAAFDIVQQLSVVSGNDREVASEYGRLALDLDQASLAARALQVADDPSAPDWRVISARGAAAAKMGQYAEAVPFFERALSLMPNNASLLNNLAMAYAATGEADRAEEMLRRALELKPDDVRIRQNLGIVLGLKGEHDKARQLAGAGPGADDVAANATLLQKMVRVSAAAPSVAVAPATASIPPNSPKKPGKSQKATSVASAELGATPVAAAGQPGFSDQDADSLIRKAIAAAPAKTP